MTEIRNMDSNLVMSSSSSSACEKLLNGLEEMGAGKISVFTSDESTTNGFMNQNGAEYRSDNFTLDIDSFDTPNSRFTLQKNLSRKGSQRGFEKKTNEKDAIVTTCSPRAGLGGNSTPGSPVVMAANHLSSNHPQAHQHQITISSSNAESKWGLRRNSFRRSSSSLGFDPKRILFFFATLSSMGTMILIYFTLSMRKLNEEGDDGTLN